MFGNHTNAGRPRMWFNPHMSDSSNRPTQRLPAVPCATDVSATFGKGIQPQYLRLCPDGAIHVSLGDDWAALVQHLSHFRDTRFTTTNAAASLTQKGALPLFGLCECGRFATTRDKNLGFDFAEWSRVWAGQIPGPRNLFHTLAIIGPDGEAAHQILIGNERDAARLSDFARQFQGDLHSAPPWLNRRGKPCPGYFERFRNHKRCFIDHPDSPATQLSPEMLPDLFEGILRERQRIKTTVVSAPAIQSSRWLPTRLERYGSSLTFSSTTTQWRVDLELVDEVWSLPLTAELGGEIVLEFYDAQGQIWCALKY
jgi:hypothetical protein